MLLLLLRRCFRRQRRYENAAVVVQFLWRRVFYSPLNTFTWFFRCQIVSNPDAAMRGGEIQFQIIAPHEKTLPSFFPHIVSFVTAAAFTSWLVHIVF